MVTEPGEPEEPGDGVATKMGPRAQPRKLGHSPCPTLGRLEGTGRESTPPRGGGGPHGQLVPPTLSPGWGLQNGNSVFISFFSLHSLAVIFLSQKAPCS